MYELIEANAWVALRLPSDSIKVLQVAPNTTISLGKYGSFPSNLIIERPYHVTYELEDKRPDESFHRIRIVPHTELYADTVAEEAAGVDAESGTPLLAEEDVEYTVVDTGKDEVVARSTQEFIDEDARQTLTMEEIEALKREGAGAGKELITKLMLRHTALDLKTQFSLSKYKLLKTRKYIRRFTVLPYDPIQMGQYLLEDKEAGNKIMEMRDEMTALLACWANVHYGGPGDDAPGSIDTTDPVDLPADYDQTVRERWEQGEKQTLPEAGRWLVVDDTGGLLVASLAEKMGILYPKKGEETSVEAAEKPIQNGNQESLSEDKMEIDTTENGVTSSENVQAESSVDATEETATENGASSKANKPIRPKLKRPHDFQVPFSTSNTITLVHQNSQANLSYLRQYGYDVTNPNHPPHPLLPHLLTLTWLQLIYPEADTTYSTPPPIVSPEDIASWKANRRGNYHRKRRRWARIRHIVETARGGNFSGLVVASSMDPISILRHALPLLAGGAPVAVYSPTLEPLTKLADCYSVARRGAWMSCADEEEKQEPEGGAETSASATPGPPKLVRKEGTDEFPVNPTLLLGVSIQTSRVRKWQVLPNRTHPLMTSRGGAEGYVLTGWRAVPAEGKVEARGKFVKKQKREA
ncbi:tRNA (adenine(58)-N(1))-methyltransferase non-catalytic subunit trm6 [Pyricularia oryzae]